MTDKTLYQFNYSQDIVHLQTVYSLFNRVSNIIFSVTFDEGFDDSLMTNAIQLLMERNDCLRLKFVKEGKVTKQYFEAERYIGEIPSLTFRTNCQMYSFIRKFRRKAIDVRKGETMNVVFATDPTGNKMLIIKISHMVADTYGIGILVNDLYAIYQALKNRTSLPVAPGRFEDILSNDTNYRANDAAIEKDRAFFQEYYQKRHPDRPDYCGIHGNSSDHRLILKR